MAIAEINFESFFLSGNTHLTIILPDLPAGITPAKFYEKRKTYKVLYLLHGTFGDSSDWIRKSKIELYASERNLVVVMPSYGNTEMRTWSESGSGLFMEDFFINEVLPLTRSWLPISSQRENTYIGGLSMGAAASLSIAIKYPELFAGVIALSGAPENYEENGQYWKQVGYRKVDELSEDCKNRKDKFGSMLNLWHHNIVRNAGGFENLVANSAWKQLEHADPLDLPAFYIAIGEKDFLYKNVLAFCHHCDDLKIGYFLTTDPTYSHEWRFWDKYIELGLDFFKIGG